jgi:hypothetical protein
MAIYFPQCSNKRIKLQGQGSYVKSQYYILNKFYYPAMQQICDKCDDSPCQHLFYFTCNPCDQCSDMLMYFPSSLTLPWSEELRWDRTKCYTISPNEVRNLYLKQYEIGLQQLQMEWLDWCYWDVSVVTSLVQSVLHELHQDKWISSHHQVWRA